MTQFIPKAVLCFLPLAALCSLAYGQDIPAVTTAPTFQGFQLPTENGTLHYAISFAERLRAGYYGTGTNIWATDISGDAAYLSRSVARPFSLVYAGGYLHNSGGIQSSVFHNLTLSQTFTTRLWSTNIANTVSYLPESPSSGLSGIPGVGDVGVTPPPATGQDILSLTGQRISNTTNASVQRQLTGSTSIQGGGGYFLQRFLTDTSNGIDGQSLTAQAGANHRIDALNKVDVNYVYNRFSYQGQDFTFSTQKITIGYTKQINRQLTIHGMAGPQVVSSANSALASTSANFSFDGGISYAGQFSEYSVGYSRGVRGNSGVVQGTFADSVYAEASRGLGEYMRLAATASYSHNSSISNLTTQSFNLQTTVGNLQLSRTISKNIDAFLSYTLQHQGTSNLPNVVNAFTGSSQTFGFGITYSPRQLHVGH